MTDRIVATEVLKLSEQYPVVTILGPRQSGKTTLCKQLFPDKVYVSLEELDLRQFATDDPRGFLEKYCQTGVVLDEIQRVPSLLSYVQTEVDLKNKNGQFILTGSHQFDLMQSVDQSLAGRTALVKLLPYSVDEIYNKETPSLLKVLYTGFYPRIFEEQLDPTQAMAFYTATYVERDLRQLINIKDLTKFENFLKLCAARVGQVLNYSSLGSDCGIDQHTVKEWLSILEASFIIRLLHPYYKNFNKRLVKNPKLYFIDTGLLCYLLNIKKVDQLDTHPLLGSIFECFIVSELCKKFSNKVENDNLYFFRDHRGREVDVIFDNVVNVDQLEIKLGKTLHGDVFSGLNYLKKSDLDVSNSYLVYGGEDSRVQGGVDVIPWKSIGGLDL